MLVLDQLFEISILPNFIYYYFFTYWLCDPLSYSAKSEAFLLFFLMGKRFLMERDLLGKRMMP